jgi:hypothetical protein
MFNEIQITDYGGSVLLPCDWEVASSSAAVLAAPILYLYKIRSNCSFTKARHCP